VMYKTIYYKKTLESKIKNLGVMHLYEFITSRDHHRQLGSVRIESCGPLAS
jgi:hypothetical protein